MIPEKREISLAVFPASVKVQAMLARFPEVQRLLFSSGIPEDFLSVLYSRADHLTIVDVPHRGRLVRFGNGSHFSDGLFIDPTNGEVVEVAQGEIRSFVNSSLEQFCRTVSAVVERFPFYTRDAEAEEIDAVAQDLAAIISRIDPPAMNADLFWSTFVDDVSIGDYTTEDVLDTGK